MFWALAQRKKAMEKARLEGFLEGYEQGRREGYIQAWEAAMRELEERGIVLPRSIQATRVLIKTQRMRDLLRSYIQP